jgi:hypothetical protein
MAAQFSLMKVLPWRLLWWCKARATNSLPVPVSPSSSTVASLGATFATFRMTSFRALLLPIISANPSSVSIASSR